MSADTPENTDSPETEPAPEQAAARPLLQVVGGNPNDEELAVLTAIIAGAASGDGGPTVPPSRNEWGHADDRLRPPWGSPSSFTNLRR